MSDPLNDGVFSNDLMDVRRHRKTQEGLSLVPIIDMMTTIIFFLVISTSFLNYTKHTLPPSGVSTQLAVAKIPPLQPQLYVREGMGGVELLLKWEGASPSKKSKRIRKRGKKFDQDIMNAAKALVGPLKKKFPKEKTLQLGLSSRSRYQLLISAMDGVQKSFPDVVLLSHVDTDDVFIGEPVF